MSDTTASHTADRYRVVESWAPYTSERVIATTTTLTDAKTARSEREAEYCPDDEVSVRILDATGAEVAQ